MRDELGGDYFKNGLTYNADPLFPIKEELSSLHRIDYLPRVSFIVMVSSQHDHRNRSSPAKSCVHQIDNK
jgi:hypothetical protein